MRIDLRLIRLSWRMLWKTMMLWMLGHGGRMTLDAAGGAPAVVSSQRRRAAWLRRRGIRQVVLRRTYAITRWMIWRRYRVTGSWVRGGSMGVSAVLSRRLTWRLC
jgi:hypothetical protein